MQKIIKLINNNKTKVLLDQGVYSAFGFAVNLLLARKMSLYEFGIYSSFILLLQLVLSISNAIIIQPFQSASKSVTSKLDYPCFLVLTQTLFILLCLSIAFVILNYFVDFNLSYFKLSLFISTFLFHDFFRKYYLAKLEIVLVLLMDSFVAVTQVFAILLLIYLKALNINNIFLVLGLTYSFSALYLFYVARPLHVEIGNLKGYISYHKKEGSWLSLVSIVQWSSANIFILPLAVMVNVEALGAFRLVQSFFGILNIIFQTYENYVLPQACKIYEESVHLSKKYLLSISKQSMLIVAIVLAFLFLFSQQIMLFIGGERYLQYQYVIKGMSCLYFVLFVGYPIRLSIRMLLLTRTFFVGYLISFAVSLLFFKSLVHQFQINGVILGLIMNQIIVLLFWNYNLMKQKFYLWK